jgi:ABC-2 type transport system permease protein
MVGAPALSLVFFLTLMEEGLPSALPVAVVDMDNSAASRSLVRRLDAFAQTDVVMQTPSFTEARLEVQKGNIYGIYYIPKGFSVKAVTGQQPVLSFYTNQSSIVPGSLLFRDMKITSILAGASVGLQKGLAQGETESRLMAQIQPVVIDTHATGNPWLNYSVYLNNAILPGILQLMILLVTVFSVSTEIKYATAHEWLRTGNNSLTVCLLGKLLPHTALFTAVAFAFALVLYGYCSFPLNSGWAPMLAALFLLVTASQAMGVFMVGTLPVPRLGLSLAGLFGMISFSIIGLSYPVSSMHPSLQALSNLFPIRHYFLIYVDQALNGRDLFYSWIPYTCLAGFLLLPLLTGRYLKRALASLHYIP